MLFVHHGKRQTSSHQNRFLPKAGTECSSSRHKTLSIKELDLPIYKTTFSTDSTLVLPFLRNETQRFQTYVANRATKILEGSSVAQWFHVPSERNPADMRSRSVASLKDLLKNQRDQQKSWYKGPKFCWNDTETKENESKIIEKLFCFH